MLKTRSCCTASSTGIFAPPLWSLKLLLLSLRNWLWNRCLISQNSRAIAQRGCLYHDGWILSLPSSHRPALLRTLHSFILMLSLMVRRRPFRACSGWRRNA